jgi:ribosomal protein L11 methylase PrmA
MLEDHKRTGAYYNACMQNRAQFAGKTVLDVGTGSGILAIFAAKAGARRRAVVRWVVQLPLLPGCCSKQQ